MRPGPVNQVSMHALLPEMLESEHSTAKISNQETFESETFSNQNTLVRDGLKKVKRFRGGLVFKAHKRVYDSTLGSRVIKKKKKGP